MVVESVILVLCKGDDKSHSSKSSYSMIENSSKTPVNQMRAEHRGTNAKEATDELLGAAVGESGPVPGATVLSTTGVLILSIS